METDFEKRVYDAVSLIPKGSVATYGEIAKKIGCQSARAVGQALRKNPYAPKVPCHRVISADGSLGGFFGSRSDEALARKMALLESEGVIIRDGRVVR